MSPVSLFLYISYHSVKICLTLGTRSRASMSTKGTSLTISVIEIFSAVKMSLFLKANYCRVIPCMLLLRTFLFGSVSLMYLGES